MMGFLIPAIGAFIGSQNMRKREEAKTAKEDALKAQQQTFENTLKTQGEQDYRTVNGLNQQTGARNPLPGLPSSLTQISPGNKGKPRKLGSMDDLQAQFQHAASVASFYAKNPDPQAQLAARHFQAQATELAGLIRQQQVEAERQAAETQRQQFQMQLRQTPTYANLHPRASGRGRSGGGGSGVDSDTISMAEQAIMKSANPHVTAEGIAMRAQAAGASSKTLAHIRAMGSYYQGKYKIAHPAPPNPLLQYLKQP
jgi:hypothetical protein